MALKVNPYLIFLLGLLSNYQTMAQVKKKGLTDSISKTYFNKFCFKIPQKYWRDTICQNNLRLSYTPKPMTATVQTPPVYDFIGNTLIQVFSGIATTKNDTNLSFSTLVNGFGNLSILVTSPFFFTRSKSKSIVFYSDYFFLATATVPNQTGTIDEVLGTTGIGLNNSLLLKGDLNKLHFVIRHKIGMSYGHYPGLRAYANDKLIFYHCFQFRIKSSSGALVFDFPLKITQINIKPLVSVGYYQKI